MIPLLSLNELDEKLQVIILVILFHSFLENVFYWSRFKALSRDILFSWTFDLFFINFIRHFTVSLFVTMKFCILLHTPNETSDEIKMFFLFSGILILKNPVFFFNTKLNISYQQFSNFLSFMDFLSSNSVFCYRVGNLNKFIKKRPCHYVLIFLSVFPNNVRIDPKNMKIAILYHMNNTFWSNIFLEIFCCALKV